MVVSGCHILFLKNCYFFRFTVSCVFLFSHLCVSPQNIMSTAYTYVHFLYNGVYKLNRCTNKDQSAHVFVSFSPGLMILLKTKSPSIPKMLQYFSHALQTIVSVFPEHYIAASVNRRTFAPDRDIQHRSCLLLPDILNLGCSSSMYQTPKPRSFFVQC